MIGGINCRPDRIYIVKPLGASGPFKIGSSSDIVSRFQQIQAWSPVELEVVYQGPGDKQVEKRLHWKLAGSRLHGEWFEGTSEVFDVLDRLQRGELASFIVADVVYERGIVAAGRARSKQGAAA